MTDETCAPKDKRLINSGWIALAIYVLINIATMTLFLTGHISDTVLLVLNLELSFVSLMEARVQFLLQSYVKRDVKQQGDNNT